MKKKFRVLISVGSCIFALALMGFGATYFTFLHRYKGKVIVNNWNESDTFDINEIKTLSKQKDKDFVILNFADIQICDLEDMFTRYKLHNYLDKLVDTYKPDLITLSGDQTWSNENLLSLKSIINWLDGYKIPYAPVFGNHDYGNEYNSAVAGLNYCCDSYEGGKYSLFNRGPTNIGSLGNYAINIKEEDKIISTLYMMDLGYNDKITEDQKSWFKWTADGIKANNNNTYTNGIVITHKELPECYDAYRHYLLDNSIAEGDVIVHMGFADVENTGFVDLAKSCGVYDFMFGHEHYNNFTIHHENARYTFMVKTGEFFDTYQDETVHLCGATTITLSSDEVNIQHHYIEP